MTGRRTVTVITDSAAALPPDQLDRYGIRVVPLWLQIGRRRIRDGDIGLDELVDRFDEPISTSAPSPGEYASAIAEARERGPVVVLTVASRMSSSHDAAALAAKLVADDHAHVASAGLPLDDASMPGAGGGDPDVVALDTGTAAGAQALIVLAAAEAATSGAGLADVVAATQRVAARVRLVATVADLERLARSGRVPEAARWIGDRLGVRPLFEFRDGGARPLRPAFSRDAAYERIVQRCVADAPGGDAAQGRLHAVVLHALDPAGARDLRARLGRLGPTQPASCTVGPFSPVMVAHTGRGLAGLAWWWDR